MANNYLQFSEMITNLTPEQVEWIKKELTPPTEETVKVWLADHPLDDPGNHDMWPNFGWKIEDDSRKERKDLWLYSEDQGDLEHLIIFMQRFLHRWSPEVCFTLTWAQTCSRPIVSEFGGGWLVVSANAVRSGDTWSAAQAAVKELQCTPS